MENACRTWTEEYFMPTQEDFEMALSIAQEEYREQDAGLQAGKASVQWFPSSEKQNDGYAEIPFLGTIYEVRGPKGEVCYKEDQGKDPALWEKILLLHYFNTSAGTPLTKKLINFKDLPEGKIYLPNFEKRAVAPLLGRFGKNPDEVGKAASKIGGKVAEFGDYSVVIPAFPCVPITLVFWKADEEFPARLSILFDESVSSYLPKEDIILSAQMLAFRLIGLAK